MHFLYGHKNFSKTEDTIVKKNVFHKCFSNNYYYYLLLLLESLFGVDLESKLRLASMYRFTVITP